MATMRKQRRPKRSAQAPSQSDIAIGTSLLRAKRLERLVARVSAADKALIAQAAALAGQSVGSFMVSEARKAALETIETRERIVLSAAESRRFVEALLAPPQQPTARMLSSLSRYRALVASDS